MSNTDHTDTHHPGQSHIDEQCRRASGSFAWLLEHEHKAGSHPIVPSNDLKVLMCGEEAFGQIACDIEQARHSIDIICWGFDPGMELVRRDDHWPRGQPYGSLLRAAAERGVKVRLLVWHEPGPAAQRQNNMPGLTGDQRSGCFVGQPDTTREGMSRLGLTGLSPVALTLDRDLGTPEQRRHDYCVQWWRDVQSSQPSGKMSGQGGSIEFRTRLGASNKAVQRSLHGRPGEPGSAEADLPTSSAGSLGGAVHEKTLIEDHATHHQKTLLIDYAYKDGEKAVGHVMGLNSLTDYWDTSEHLFDTPKRETDWACKSETAQALTHRHPISRDPYHDYVCRVAGPALRGVHKNFVDAWKRAGGAVRPDDADVLPARIVKTSSPYRAQIVRTQPQEGDKTVKKTYFHAPQMARDYLYVENQYFFYEEWVRHLKDKRKTFMQWLQGAGKCSGESPLLHLFVVIPWPEDNGMVPRTYDTLKSLGEGASMPAQHAAMNDKDAAVRDSMAYDKARTDTQQRYLNVGLDPTEPMRALPKPKNYIDTGEADPVYVSALAVKAPEKNHTTGELQGLGLKVVLGRLTTVNRGKPLPKPELNYRQVYIHSKLMVIDDAFFTVGSANLNLRSMAADSELNIASDDHKEAARLRKMVWQQHAGGYGQSDGGSGDRAAIIKAFGHWQEVMRHNKDKMPTGKDITGFLVPFVDKRRVNYRHG